MQKLPETLVAMVDSARLAVPSARVGSLYGIRAVESYDPFCTVCHLQITRISRRGARAKNEVRTLGGWHKSAGGVRCISCTGKRASRGMIP